MSIFKKIVEAIMAAPIVTATDILETAYTLPDTIIDTADEAIERLTDPDPEEAP